MYIFQSTSSGNCVVSPNPASVVRNSPSLGKSASSSKVSSSSKNNAAAAAGEITNKLNNITSNVVTSSTLPTTNDSTLKLNIKLSNTDYPQVIHNETSANECNIKNDTNRTASPLPKLTIRRPKPTEKPLEIITTGQGSPFRSSENESQQSPRIILKINKNTTSQANESSTLTSTTIIASDDLQTRSDSPQLTAKQQNELKRSNYEVSAAEFSAVKKQKLNDIDNVQLLLSSDSECEDKDQQFPPLIKHKELNEESNENEKLSTESKNVPNDLFETTTSIASNSSISFNTNSGLRSILSRPQMKIQPPQILQSFLQALPPFKGITATAAAAAAAAACPANEESSKLNDVIDLCHDSNDQIDESLLNDELTSHGNKEVSNELNNLNESVAKTPQSGDQNKNSTYSWQSFYNDSTKEQIQPVHPLLQQNIERANVLAAMMEAANKQENSTNENDNNNTAILEQTNSSNNLLFENEGSSSDCIVIEDTASEPFASELTRTENLTELNGSKKECVDRDSGVDVSNSVKSIAEDDTLPTVKRPRGRPRKGNAIKTIIK